MVDGTGWLSGGLAGLGWHVLAVCEGWQAWVTAGHQFGGWHKLAGWGSRIAWVTAGPCFGGRKLVTACHQTKTCGGHMLADWQAGWPGSLQVTDMVKGTGWQAGGGAVWLGWARAGCLGEMACLGHCRSPNWWRAQAGWLGRLACLGPCRLVDGGWSPCITNHVEGTC